ncbi:hypothetical protein F4604DRAFT_1878922 [Suillus subluteus]|nr:hypothetical protein F4604DRAFT_1878922 [Suillus subluteus]
MDAPLRIQKSFNTTCNMIALKFTGQDEYTDLFLSPGIMGKKKQKLVHHTAEQLTDAPAPHLHMASIYSFQSGKPLVCMESLTSSQLLPLTIRQDEDPLLAPNPFQVWDAGNFLEHMPYPDGYIVAWEPECPIFLDELIRLEGRGDYIMDSLCGHCQETPPTIRCKDCFLPELHCPLCTRWNGTYFERITLKTLGLRIQLGHQIRDACCNPCRAFNNDFVIIDTTGIHEVALDFCGCRTMQTHYHLLSFESKASAYEFYQGLARLSDNTGIKPPKDCYPTFLHIIHEWRILKLLKSFTQGHCPDGVPTTEPGQCAVLCPACPQPGMNLPEDWKDASPDKQWLYALFVSIDANFRLKRKFVSSDIADAGINKGWSYFVEEKAYKAYLEDHKDRNQERSTCASHNAVNMADTKKSQGLAATVGDLQKGEKYINMDYLFFSAMRHHEVVVLNVSYDIACQWSKHLCKTINFFIPKFHLLAHIEPCQIDFSFNFSQHVSHTDGEAPERGWANINPIASSMKEMGPGSWCDTLNDHFGDWNWKHCTQLGQLTARKLVNAIEERSNHQRKLIKLEGCMQMEDISQWRDEVEAWEQDCTKTNPFKVQVAPETQATIRLELARIEAKDLETGNNISLHADVPPSILISSGIDLEEQQRRLSFGIEALGAHTTDNQLAKVQQHTNTLRRKINTWQDVQLLYMPFVSCLHASEESTHSSSELTPVEAIWLWLPSTVSSIAQCSTQLRRFEWMFKDNNIVGQAANTHARSMINKADNKISMAAGRYEAARVALTSLAPLLNEDDAWKDDMWEKEMSGTRHLSWIWKTPGVSENTSVSLHDALRIEWCKARAHAMQWEEVKLLKEEQRRIIAFLDWQADWWWSQRQHHDLESLDNPGLGEVLEFVCVLASVRLWIREVCLMSFKWEA